MSPNAPVRPATPHPQAAPTPPAAPQPVVVTLTHQPTPPGIKGTITF